MCGLAGIVDGSGRFGIAQSRAMALAIAHRGPDDHADWTDDALPVSFSFRRLAIIDTRAEANQPFHHGHMTLCFNGEIYNYRELRRELETQYACSFHTESDTEVLLQAFAVWGVASTLPKLNGMYAIALLDRAARTVTLARDRFGEKPLYYTVDDEALLFASEIKALAAVIDLNVDSGSVSAYFRYGFIPAPRTIYQRVRALEPGEWCTYTIPGLNVADRGTVPRHSARMQQDGFKNVLTRALDIRLRSDVPLGVFLSGGVDSSLLLALASQRLDRALPSFTVRMMDAAAAYDEAPQAARFAAFCGSENHVLELSERSLLDALPAQIAHMDQPLADAAIIPTALLSHMARQHVTVALGGEGGDELQAGYTRHRQQKYLEYLLRSPLGRSFVRIAKPFAAMGRAAGLPQLERQMDKTARLLDLYRGDAYDAVMAQWNVDGVDAKFPRDFRKADTEFYLPHDLLMKLDGATMQASLEGRCPYLDPDLWACLHSMPRAAWANKKLSRALLRTLVPAELMPRAKRGLTLPLAGWLRGELRDWAQTQTEIVKASGILPPDAIDAEWDALQRQQTQHAQPLWALCLFSAWCAAHKITI